MGQAKLVSLSEINGHLHELLVDSVISRELGVESGSHVLVPNNTKSQ